MEALEAAAGEVPKEEIERLFHAQREAFHAELPVSYEARMDRIKPHGADDYRQQGCTL